MADGPELYPACRVGVQGDDLCDGEDDQGRNVASVRLPGIVVP